MKIVDWLKRNYKPLLLTIAIVLLVDGAILLAFNRSARSPSPSGSQNIAPSAPLNEPKIELTQVVSGLQQPTAIVSTGDKNDPRIFIVEQSGVIRIVQDGKAAQQPLLNISKKVRNSGEMGLLGLAFHPDYKNNRYFYVNYVDTRQHTVIARFQTSRDTDNADVSSEKVLLDIPQPYKNHNGGDLVFGPDGFLYAALGDGGSAGDPQNRAQSLDTLLGKILRLDVDKGDPYAIPTGNPFIEKPGARTEIWAYGLRNPWRISFDRQTKEMFITDVGQGDYEEINVELAGKGGNNYGWRCYEAGHDFNLSGCEPKDKYVFPVLEYDHSENRCSVTGGYVYRGQKHKALLGKYFYGDFCGGQLYFAYKQNGQWQTALAAATTYQISCFGQDSQGELYLADYAQGNIYQIRDSAN